MRRLYFICSVLLIASIAFAGYLKGKEYGMEDLKPPVIEMNDDTLEISVEDSEDEILRGITATDNKDGDVTDSLIVDSISEFTEDGRRFATIAAFDSSNNVAKATKVITYKDYKSPRFSIKAPMTFRTNEKDFLEEITVKDSLDGDITNSLKFSDNTTIYAYEDGLYPVELLARNSAGDTVTLPITLEITSDLYSARVQLKKYIVYTKKGKTVDYDKLLDCVLINGKEWDIVSGSDYEDGEIGRSRIKIDDSDVNYNKKGVYEVKFKVDTVIYDEDGEPRTEVDEETIPVVRLVIVVEGK